MIDLQQIKVSFNEGQQNEVLALKSVDLKVSKGQYLVVVGANGSGKSTLLNVISGTVRPKSGRVLLQDRDISLLPDYKRSKYIARVFQNPLSGTAPDLSIIDNFRLAALRTQKKTLRIGLNDTFRVKVADRLSDLGMGLENKLDQAMGTLSGGQRQAITLLMSVMDDLDVLLLDEPTAALDPRSAETVMRIADELIKRHQLTAVLITHNLKDALIYGDRVIQMVDGKIERDVLSEAKTHLSASEIYGWFMS